MVFWSLNVKAVWPIYCLKKWSSTTLFSSGMQLQKLSLMCTRLIIKRNFHAHSHPLIMQYMNEVWHNLKFHLHIIKDHTTLCNYVSSKSVLRITASVLFWYYTIRYTYVDLNGDVQYVLEGHIWRKISI